MQIDLMSFEILEKDLEKLIDIALNEDLGSSNLDATSSAIISDNTIISANIVNRNPCRIAGLKIVEKVFKIVDEKLICTSNFKDKDDVSSNTNILKVHGRAKSILLAERTVLNLFQRMCSIATTTNKFVQVAQRPDLLILDTRKTTPGLRLIEKMAVSMGGGVNHRMGLYDAIMIKDNHLSIWESYEGKGINEAVTTARNKFPKLKIQIEVDQINQLKTVLNAKPDWILLDNMSVKDLKKSVILCRDICKTEASGGINLDTIKRISATGVDAVSIGALTHSPEFIDLGLDFTL